MRKNPARRRAERSNRPSNLKRIRTEEGIDRSDLAKAADVADRTVDRVETGEEASPRATTLYKILNGLNGLRNKNRRKTDYGFREVFPNHNEE